MRKGISESKVKRMRDLVAGNYNAKSKIASGYTKSKKEYKEGDIWIENKKIRSNGSEDISLWSYWYSLCSK